MEWTSQQSPYDLLQVSPRAHPMIIAKAYHLLAGYYHPDNKQTGDEQTFRQIVEAYRFLSDPLLRSAYDRETLGSMGTKINSAALTDETLLVPARRGVEEREVRELILRALYDVRRGRPYKPSLSLVVLSEMFGCTIEDLQFSLWYLRGKHLIETVEDSDLVITVEGVDHLEGGGLGWNGDGPDLGIDRQMALPPLPDEPNEPSPRG